MSGNASVDAIIANDDFLKNFIFAANDCMENGRFLPDNRYRAVRYEFSRLPMDKLREFADVLQVLSQHYPKMENFYQLFVAEFEF